MNLIRRISQLLLLIQDTPQRTASAFALGVFLGFSPLIGIHTLLGLLLAYVFRLSKIAVLLGVYINNPWLILPYYGLATWVGLKITGVSYAATLPEFGFRELFRVEFWRSLVHQYQLLLPAVVGSTILAGLFAVVAYALALHGLKKAELHNPG